MSHHTRPAQYLHSGRSRRSLSGVNRLQIAADDKTLPILAQTSTPTSCLRRQSVCVTRSVAETCICGYLSDDSLSGLTPIPVVILREGSFPRPRTAPCAQAGRIACVAALSPPFRRHNQTKQKHAGSSNAAFRGPPLSVRSYATLLINVWNLLRAEWRPAWNLSRAPQQQQHASPHRTAEKLNSSELLEPRGLVLGEFVEKQPEPANQLSSCFLTTHSRLPCMRTRAFTMKEAPRVVQMRWSCCISVVKMLSSHLKHPACAGCAC